MNDALCAQYLRDAFTRKSVLYAAVDLQKKYYSPHLHDTFEKAGWLADQLRPTARVMWVQQTHIPDSGLYYVTPHTRDRRCFKKDKYEPLLDHAIRNDGIDTVIVSGIFAEACVKAFVKQSVVGRGLTAIVAADAIDSLEDLIPPIDEADAGTLKHAKKMASLLYGPQAVSFTSAEILACRP